MMRPTQSSNPIQLDWSYWLDFRIDLGLSACHFLWDTLCFLTEFDQINFFAKLVLDFCDSYCVFYKTQDAQYLFTVFQLHFSDAITVEASTETLKVKSYLEGKEFLSLDIPPELSDRFSALCRQIWETKGILRSRTILCERDGITCVKI